MKDHLDPKTAASNAGKALRAFRGKTGAPPSVTRDNPLTKKSGPPAIPSSEPKSGGIRSRLSRFGSK